MAGLRQCSIKNCISLAIRSSHGLVQVLSGLYRSRTIEEVRNKWLSNPLPYVPDQRLGEKGFGKMRGQTAFGTGYTVNPYDELPSHRAKTQNQGSLISQARCFPEKT